MARTGRAGYAARVRSAPYTRADADAFREANLPLRRTILGVVAGVNLALAPIYFWADLRILALEARPAGVVYAVMAVHGWIVLTSLAALAYLLAHRRWPVTAAIHRGVVLASVVNFVWVGAALAVINQRDTGSYVIFAMAGAIIVVLAYERPRHLVWTYLLGGAAILAASEAWGTDPAHQVSVRLNLPLTVGLVTVGYLTYDRFRIRAFLKSRELLHWSAFKDTLFQALGHDLKDPLVDVRRAVRLLEAERDAGRLGPDVAALPEQLEVANDRAFQVIDNLMAVGAPEGPAGAPAGAPGGALEPVSLHDEVREARQRLRLRAAAKDVRLEVDLPGDVLMMAQPAMLQSVLQNLLGNAVKFAPPGGRARLSAEVEAHRVVLHVDDDGDGPPEGVRAIVEADARTPVATPSHGTAGEAGTGLGLLVVRTFLDRMDSRLTLGPAAGGGTRATFALPRYRAGRVAKSLRPPAPGRA